MCAYNSLAAVVEFKASGGDEGAHCHFEVELQPETVEAVERVEAIDLVGAVAAAALACFLVSGFTDGLAYTQRDVEQECDEDEVGAHAMDVGEGGALELLVLEVVIE